MIEGETDAGKMLPLVHKRIRNKHTDDTIKASPTGVISDTDRDILRMSMEEVGLYNTQIQEWEEKMRLICNEYFHEEMELL